VSCRLTRFTTIRGDRYLTLLKDAKAVPKPAMTLTVQPPAVPQAPTAEPTAAPLCAVHQVTMVLVEGKHGRFWSCHKKILDGSWCSSRAQCRIGVMPCGGGRGRLRVRVGDS
jgi:hypothetical protein